ncbi:hypothetical protein SERLA73DRAFT_98785 [Serpula lacrymans var. lacrymans S7.3]|uniref:Trafficking protein particle complex subunit 11 domain-containing protein n=1 Tax=Serpula lacrymans var. lacrymans (strain S7.3) TaxID=936435 RepID=F8QFZ6_SERL3|nr:hypothetical protein SERLA73DRAFT_98785 [Serpula lacrymans var. lacrymans S7.3]
MNSYPPELLVQLAPVMFVAGLDPPPGQPLPTPSKTQDPFISLTLRLREALQSQRKSSIWAPERNKTFQILLVDKSVRFPPRKTVSPDDPQFPTAHSPLSPLTPTSPLYPDGLVAPIWIRKHTALVPSVFVLFLRLFEAPPVNPRSPLDPPDAEHERERIEDERKRDTELSTEIALRKRITNERGIKLTVVLMASRRMLDDPSLDGRLTYVRRQSGLDSRAALFVLSPVTTSELNDFVRSLQDALYDPAVEYYTAHSKRVRRKRNRHSQAVSSYNPTPLSPLGSGGGLGVPRPLKPEGWTVRYEYKMACFAEFRGEDEVALKHYQDAYATLLIMFGSTAILPPRTKRWAEAKVLADCMNLKICKLYLYNNEHALALSHHNSHVRKFADFSRGWGIGEETFEYWSWMARQHRVLAELLEQGSRTTLTIPTHKPVPQPRPTTPSTGATSTIGTPFELDAVRSLGMNPSHALQHPGFYYYMAARCTEIRRERYLAVEGSEATQQASAAPGLVNEKKVDHLTIILELYTKSYELFKKYGSPSSQGRLTLWIAYRIAQTYYESNKFDMAVRFFERIAKTYRREKWGHMLHPLLSTWYACAQRLGDVELTVKLLLEMLGSVGMDVAGTLQDDLIAVLKSTIPASPEEPLVIEPAEIEPLLDTISVFWKQQVRVAEAAAFQLSLSAPLNTVISSLPIDSISVFFSEGFAPLTIRHSAPSEPKSSDRVPMQLVKVGHVESGGETRELQADLRWRPGDILVLAGTISSEVPLTIKVSKILLTLKEASWVIEIPLAPCASRDGVGPVPRWLSCLDPIIFVPIAREEYSTVAYSLVYCLTYCNISTSVHHRPHQLAVSFSHEAPALVDEEFPIVINITNTDERDLDVVIDVLLQPTEFDEADNQIIIDDQRSSGLLRGIHLGNVAPGVTALKTLYLVNNGAAGDRTVDISIQSRSVSPGRDLPNSPQSPTSRSASDMTETLETLVIPTVKAVKASYDVRYQRALGKQLGISDLRMFEDGFWDDAHGGEAIVSAKLECSGPWKLEIESLKLIPQNGENAKIVDNSLDGCVDDMFPDEYLPGDEFSDTCRISLAPDEDQVLAGAELPCPGTYEISWRRISPNGDRGPLSVTQLPLPALCPPKDGLIALLRVPSVAKLHTPMSMQLIVRNRHPSRSANIVVQLDPESLDGFIVSGLRSGRVQTLLPGGEEKVRWRLIPVECGHVSVPRVKVMDRRKGTATSQAAGTGQDTEAESEGEIVKVVDVKWDWRGPENGDKIVNVDQAKVGARVENENVKMSPEQRGANTILVLP